MFKSLEGNFDNPKVHELLSKHFVELRAASPEGSTHVLDIPGLKISSIKLPENVTPTIQGRDFVIATLAAPTIIKEPEKPAEETAEGAEGAEGSTAEGAEGDAKTAAEGDKKDSDKKDGDKKEPEKKEAPKEKK